MKRATLLIVSLALLVFRVHAQSPDTKEAFQMTAVVLYNRIADFEARSPGAEVLAPFIKQLSAKAATHWKDSKPGPGRNGLIAVAIRPNRTMKLWVDVDREFQPDITASLQKEMKAVDVPQVINAPIAFALYFSLWGGNPKTKADNNGIEIPQSWRKAAKGHGKPMLIPDDILPLVWKTTRYGTDVPRSQKL